MPKEKKYLASGLLILMTLIVIFLASGISGVEFQPGTLMVRERDLPEFTPPSFLRLPTRFWEYLLAFTMWVMLPLSVFFFIKYPEIRRKTLKGLSYFILYGFTLFLLTRESREDDPELLEAEQELIDTTIIETQREAADFISSIGPADPYLNIILDIVILLALVILIWYIYRRYFHNPPSASDQIKLEVQSAIDEISSGADLRNVIIRCYADMSEILLKQRSIERPQAMTPREFELELEEIGLPKNAIQRLTRLFEAVRYGNTITGESDEKEAVQCLNEIVEAC
jgi:hypothetical protein